MEQRNSNQENYIEKELKDKAKLHIFCSEGGMRIVRLEKNGELLSYGAYPRSPGIASMAANDSRFNHGEYEFSKDVINIKSITGISSILQKIIDCFYLCGDSIDIYYSEREHQFVCSTPSSLSAGGRSYSGVGNGIINAIYSCIHSKMIYQELGKLA